MEPILKIFIGYDSREPITFAVLAHSILRRSSIPVEITPLVQSSLRAQRIYTRERGATESTEFSLTRFLVPYLSEYKGVSIFMDSDMLCLVDIAEILEPGPANRSFRMEFNGRAVKVCQHDYVPSSSVKMDGAAQHSYPRKNWSSFMVFDNKECTKLTPELVNEASGLELHRFSWIDESKIGSLPLGWNWLVGEYETNPNAMILHYTNGAPCFPALRSSPDRGPWMEEFKNMLSPFKAADVRLSPAKG